jgi:hypothetical protein
MSVETRLDRAVLALAVDFLELASERASAAGCNDYNWAEVIPDLEVRQQIAAIVNSRNGQDCISATDEITYDFMLIDFVKWRFKDALSGGPKP